MSAEKYQYSVESEPQDLDIEVVAKKNSLVVGKRVSRRDNPEYRKQKFDQTLIDLQKKKVELYMLFYDLILDENENLAIEFLKEPFVDQ